MTNAAEQLTALYAKLAALTEFARAVDKAIVTDLGSRPGNPRGEQIGCLSADRFDDPARVRRIQKARDTLVELRILQAVK